MAAYNTLKLTMLCPRCQHEAAIEATFRFGHLDFSDYQLGDKLVWRGHGPNRHELRPKLGNHEGQAHAKCSRCARDFWLLVKVREDMLVSAEVDPSKASHLPDRPAEGSGAL